MFEGLRNRIRFRNLEERIETAEAKVKDAEDYLADRHRWHNSFGGRHHQILEAERALERAKDKHVDLLRRKIEQDSLS